MKYMIKYWLVCLSICFVVLPAQAKKNKKLPEGIYAQIITNKGIMNCRIEYQKLPLPSCVFIGLAEGTLENKLTSLGTKFYDKHKIYSVNKDKFMIFGDLSNETGEGAGFYFHDQIDSSILHSSAGVIGVVNQGPNTNSTQIYLTKKPMPNLDYKYTIFGSMLSGFDVLYLLTDKDTVKQIKITRIGKAANEFICNKESFQKYQIEQFNKAELIKKQILQRFNDSIYKYYPSTVTLPSGLHVYTVREGSGEQAPEKCKVEVRYIARFENGQVLDASDTTKAQTTQLGNGQLKRGLEEGIRSMKVGGKAILFIPYTLAYGETGYKDRVPPRTNIIYEIELMKIIKD